MSIIMFIAAILYLTAVVVVVTIVVWVAEKLGKSPWVWGVGTLLSMYLLVFWDHIPTVVMHKYYCKKEAGFWVYKTLEEWKSENPGVAETFVADIVAPPKKDGDMENYIVTYVLNQRFNWINKHNGRLPINRWRHELELIDSKTGVVLARYVDFSTSQIREQAGYAGWKFWLYCENCNDGQENYGKMLQFEGSIAQLAKK